MLAVIKHKQDSFRSKIIDENILPEEAVIPEILPLLPIREPVYFPHNIFPLFVGRDKSLRALEEARSQIQEVLSARDHSSMVPLRDVRRVRRAMKADIASCSPATSEVSARIIARKAAADLKKVLSI